MYNHTAPMVKWLVNLHKNPDSAALGLPTYAANVQGGVEKNEVRDQAHDLATSLPGKEHPEHTE